MTDLLDLPITGEFARQHLSVRTASNLANRFRSAVATPGKPTIGEVITAADEELLRTPNIGRVAIEEVHRLRAAVAAVTARRAERGCADGLSDEQLLTRVREIVSEMCKGDRWRMCVPPQADDSDVAISELADRYEQMLGRPRDHAAEPPARELTLSEMTAINSARSAKWMAGSPGWTILELAGELAGEVGELAKRVQEAAPLGTGRARQQGE